MIHVIFSRNKELSEYSLSMNGHAGYSDMGSDIVCASASTLAYTLWGFLENSPTVTELDTVERSGEMEISCIGDRKLVKTAFRMAMLGFLQLEKAYPQCVSVDTSEWE